MLKKPQTPAEILDDERRVAYAAQEIKKTILIWGAVKVGTTVAVVVGLKLLAKKLEKDAANNS